MGRRAAAFDRADERGAARRLVEAEPVLRRRLDLPRFQHGGLMTPRERTLAFDAAVTEFVDAATSGRRDRAERLLALHPGIARAGLHPALLLGDVGGVERHLAVDPALATAPGGPRQWEPLHYVCHSAMGGSREREIGLASVARLLIARGADP